MVTCAQGWSAISRVDVGQHRRRGTYGPPLWKIPPRNGSKGPELWRTFKDSTPPSGGKITTNLPAFRLTIPFKVGWGGATDSGSGVASYQAYSKQALYNGAFEAASLFKTTSAPGTGTFRGQPGNTYCFYVTVTDRVGNVSARSARECTSLPVDDAVLTGSGWRRRSGKLGYYRGTYSQASAKGATLSLTGVQEKRLALVAVTCPGCGSVQVFQGTTLMKQVSLDAESVEHRVIPLASFPSLRRGKVRIRVASAGEPVIVDGLGASRVF